MSFQIAPDPDRNVLRLIGELDIAGVDALFEWVESLAGDHASQCLYLDLAELTFIDSSGIRALIAVGKRIGGRVILLSPKPSVAKILDIVRVDSLPGLEIRRDGVAPFHGANGGSDQ
jgi:anti-sigma B factor antagonist